MDNKLTSERINEIIDDVDWARLDRRLKAEIGPLDKMIEQLESVKEAKIKEIEAKLK